MTSCNKSNSSNKATEVTENDPASSVNNKNDGFMMFQIGTNQVKWQSTKLPKNTANQMVSLRMN
jgi:hypothetical protein